MRHPSLIALSHDHHHALALALRCRKQALGQIKATGSGGLGEQVTELVSFYNDKLATHFRAEEEVLFPVMQSIASESRALVEGLTRDHQRIRSMIEQLNGGSGLSKIIFDIGDLLERHIRKEERELFPLFQKHVSTAEAQPIGSRIAEILANRRS
jgi:hemerythrin-like domain-containing protein